MKRSITSDEIDDNKNDQMVYQVKKKAETARVIGGVLGCYQDCQMKCL